MDHLPSGEKIAWIVTLQRDYDEAKHFLERSSVQEEYEWLLSTPFDRGWSEEELAERLDLPIDTIRQLIRVGFSERLRNSLPGVRGGFGNGPRVVPTRGVVLYVAYQNGWPGPTDK